MGRNLIHLDNKLLVEVERLAGNGLTNEQIADCIGISKDSLYRYKKANTELHEAIVRGRSNGVAEVVSVVKEAAVKGNMTAAIFFLKNRAGWADKVEAKNDNNHKVSIVVDDQIKLPE